MSTSEADRLAAEPAVTTGQLIGYARVSTREQHLDRQSAALDEAGCSRIFADQLSGRDTQRPQLTACLDYLRGGDTLVVVSLDRLGRSLSDLITLVGRLRAQGVGLRSLSEAIDTTTPGGRLTFHVFAALAEFVRELTASGTHEGLAAARARGQRLGRPPALNQEQVQQARALLAQSHESVSSVARAFGISRTTLYKYLPELRTTAASESESPQRSPAAPAGHHTPPAASVPGPEPAAAAAATSAAGTPKRQPKRQRGQRTTPLAGQSEAAGEVRAVARGERLDVDSVTQHRGELGRTRVLATTRNGEVVLVGYLDSVGSKQWRAYTPQATPLTGTYRTKHAALLRLLDPHQ